MTEHDPKYSIVEEVDVGKNSEVYDQVNLYKCDIGESTKIDAFVYIEEDVVIGSNCKIRPFVFIPTGVIIGDNVFVGPHVTFTNDMYPSVASEWELQQTIVKDQVGIGADATILPGIRIGEGATIGAGAVVTDDVDPGSIVVGNPAEPIER